MEHKEDIGTHIVDHLSDDKETINNPDLNNWLESSKENKESLRAYQKIWNALNFLSESNQYQTNKARLQVGSAIHQLEIRKRRIQNLLYSGVGMAASILLILSLAFYTGQFSISQNSVAMKTEYGSRSEVVLPDGSIVNLNAGSNLEYRYNRITKTREIHFTGEGYFKVAKDVELFVIHTPTGMDLKVLGTTFNLSAYSDDVVVQTSLIEGKVELSNPKGEKLVMIAGQTAQFDNQTKKIEFVKKEQDHVIGWINQKIYLDNTSMFETAKKLERCFDVEISLNPKTIGEEIHYTGVLQEGTVNDILDALSELSDIEYLICGKHITISKK